MNTLSTSIDAAFESKEPLPLYTAQQIRNIELAYAADKEQRPDNPLSGSIESGTWPLMQRAGEAAFELIGRQWPDANHLLVVCGKGNNGGDGYVIAKLALEAGLKVSLLLLCKETEITGDALIAWQQLQAKKTTQIEFNQIGLDQIEHCGADLVVDAMLGTGFKGELKGLWLRSVEAINHLNLPVLAIDIPSGVEANTGIVNSVAVEASVTITFVGIKRGLLTADALDYCGELYLAALNVDKEYFAVQTASAKAYRWPTVQNWLKPRRKNCHKGDFGHVLVVGGSNGMLGAAMLAAEASVKFGAGKTSAWVEQDAAMLVCRTPEVMARNVSAKEINKLIEESSQPSVMVIGPGLGQSEWSRAILKALINSHWWPQCAKVIDADALNMLATEKFYVKGAILTPHPGEAGRLLNCSAKQVNRDRFKAATEIEKKFQATCLLKGAGTVVASGKGEIALCAVGHPAMATGGMGDVLSGMLGSTLSSSRLNTAQSSIYAAVIHGNRAESLINKTFPMNYILPSQLFFNAQ